MSDEDDLRVNTLNRFAKRSATLALEEHGHCEVPAGCGGVVLRWVRAEAELHAAAWLSAPARSGRSELWLDGAPLDASRFTVLAGRHLLAARLDLEELLPHAPLLLAVVQQAAPSGAEARVFFRSAPGAVRAVAEEPPEGWERPGSDDGAWPALPALSVPLASLPERRRELGLWLVERYGAEPLELPSGARRVWLRAWLEISR